MKERRRAAELSVKHEALKKRLDGVLRDQRRLIVEVRFVLSVPFCSGSPFVDPWSVLKTHPSGQCFKT